MAEPVRPPLRAAVIGMNIGGTSGMRDYAELQAAQLPAEGISCSLHWLTRSERSAFPSRAEIGAWRARLADELAAAHPDVLLLHYSPFAYAHRGVPLFLGGTLRTLKDSGRPLVTLLHELAYPWHRPGARERLWALTQRTALIELMRRSRAAIATTEHNASWVRSRRWLPERPIAVAPVFSNLPAPSSSAGPVEEGLVGLFGYGNEEALMRPVLDAFGRLIGAGRDVRLLLLGAPGPDSERGRELRREAEARDLGAAVAFTGILDAQELSDRLAGCEVLLSAASPGPTSRKGTIAASLASGRPLLALDGRQSWRELIDAGAVRLSAPDGDALAEQLSLLLADRSLQSELGARGRAFAADRLSIAHGGRVLAETFRALV